MPDGAKAFEEIQGEWRELYGPVEDYFDRARFLRSMQPFMALWMVFMQFVVFNLGATVAKTYSASPGWITFGGICSLLPCDWFMIKYGLAFRRLFRIWDEDKAKQMQELDDRRVLAYVQAKEQRTKLLWMQADAMRKLIAARQGADEVAGNLRDLAQELRDEA